MKKGSVILIGAVMVAMSGLSNIAISISEDPQWTPYVLSWSRKLPKKQNEEKNLASEKDTIPVCSSSKSNSEKLQR